MQNVDKLCFSKNTMTLSFCLLIQFRNLIHFKFSIEQKKIDLQQFMFFFLSEHGF